MDEKKLKAGLLKRAKEIEKAVKRADSVNLDKKKKKDDFKMHLYYERLKRKNK